jgi:hypothetical protein
MTNVQTSPMIDGSARRQRSLTCPVRGKAFPSQARLALLREAVGSPAETTPFRLAAWEARVPIADKGKPAGPFLSRWILFAQTIFSALVRHG